MNKQITNTFKINPIINPFFKPIIILLLNSSILKLISKILNQNKPIKPICQTLYKMSNPPQLIMINFNN